MMVDVGVVNRKDIPAKYNSLGQFFTPDQTADFCLAHTDIETNLVVEPCCGQGVFLDKLRKKTTSQIIGLEVDAQVLSVYTGPEQIININFYDYNPKFEHDVTFIGNPPYRTPAISVTDDPTYGRRSVVKGLMEKYGITGMREEAVFFIVKSVDMILTNAVRGHIYYILPKTIFHNNSKAYKSFISFLKKHTSLVNVIDLPKDFDKVTTDLCYVHLSVGYGQEDGVKDFYGVNEDIITFREIFKKTYLGSVPCESVLLSVRGEPLDHFRNRLSKLSEMKSEDQLIDGLSYNGEVHLAALKKRDPNKISVVWRYVCEICKLVSVDDFLNDDNYKEIQHRHEKRYYFRFDALKRAKGFVYQLNPNPCPSFHFPGNPVKNCLDYHGYVEYDVNRNCSPSANRTVPLDVEDNLTNEFKCYWRENTDLPYECVFDYLSHVLKSEWYKDMKCRYQRWYFGVPREFLR